jgi:hypothetical protein
MPPVSLHAFTAKTERKWPFIFLFNAAMSTVIDRKIVVELRKKSCKILVRNKGGGGHDNFVLATFRHLFPEETNLYTVEQQGLRKEII